VTLNNTLTISSKPDINLSVNAWIRSKSIQATYDLPSSGSINLSAQWTFMKRKASLRLFCNDLFQTEMINPYVRFKGQNLSADYSCYRTFGLAFTYKFGGYKEKQRKEADTSRF
ncbi:MAG: outer membrane beta-barrel protein, partial [Hoylesella saccharolytica]